ncbi:MAG: hypothetical protein WCG83_00685, partial [Candidatus Peregrinibacteria bacterium]
MKHHWAARQSYVSGPPIKAQPDAYLIRRQQKDMREKIPCQMPFEILPKKERDRHVMSITHGYQTENSMYLAITFVRKGGQIDGPL